ncbi:hypothetical protein NIES2119_32000 [[Phormidium ambiguum] IAM M-71]|uniref:Uncharacterized protein n=1 Tax=[Phormidium ambiguum] IAM M-71 TaxID=454136 RepID=A0A1U7I1E8_9CYAN|nr:hypothetical protein NIES2119_32000 [Phormidium ambiguum IAM M-71]
MVRLTKIGSKLSIEDSPIFFQTLILVQNLLLVGCVNNAPSNGDKLVQPKQQKLVWLPYQITLINGSITEGKLNSISIFQTGISLHSPI